MKTGLKGLFFDATGMAWTVLQDFTPKRTLEEVSFLIDDIRRELFDQDYENVNTRLEAQLATTEESHRILVQSNAPGKQVSALKARADILEDILSLRSELRDIFAGSCSSIEELPEEWQQVSEHGGTSDFLGRKLKGVLGRMFEDRELRDNLVRIKARLAVHRETLSELRNMVSAENQDGINVKLQAIDAVRRIVTQRPRKSAGTRSAARPEGPRNGTREEEIPIE